MKTYVENEEIPKEYRTFYEGYVPKNEKIKNKKNHNHIGATSVELVGILTTIPLYNGNWSFRNSNIQALVLYYMSHVIEN